MLYFDFQNYEGFKERFGVVTHGNGNKSRKNKILLAWVKQNDLLKKAIAGDKSARALLNLRDMASLRRHIQDTANKETYKNSYSFCLNGWLLRSDKYLMDGQNGICEDGDYKAIRYMDMEQNGRIYKMKAGKFFKNVLEETDWGRSIPEPVMLWACEEFTQEWETHTRSVLPEYELHVDDNFRDIYDSDECKGDFCSCMVNDGYWVFYRDSVKAKAAYLTNKDGAIIARCIIFTEVHDIETGEVLRLAERQYSTDSEDVLKRCLVDALIKAGEIDGYKKVGAGCHDDKGFVLNNGDSLGCHDLYIECSAGPCDTVSYQDSFKYYNYDEGRAYNDDGYDYDYSFEVTGGEMERSEGRNYDSWHDEYTDDDIVTVYYHGRDYTCSEERLDDFHYIEHGSGKWEYHHEDDCVYCEDIEDYVLSDDATYSDLLGEYYYNEYDLESAEKRYKEHNWFYSEYDDEYYEDSDDVTYYKDENGTEVSISVDSLRRLEGNGEVVVDEDGMYVSVELLETVEA